MLVYKVGDLVVHDRFGHVGLIIKETENPCYFEVLWLGFDGSGIYHYTSLVPHKLYEKRT